MTLWWFRYHRSKTGSWKCPVVDSDTMQLQRLTEPESYHFARSVTHLSKARASCARAGLLCPYSDICLSTEQTGGDHQVMVDEHDHLFGRSDDEEDEEDEGEDGEDDANEGGSDRSGGSQQQEQGDEDMTGNGSQNETQNNANENAESDEEGSDHEMSDLFGGKDDGEDEEQPEDGSGQNADSQSQDVEDEQSELDRAASETSASMSKSRSMQQTTSNQAQKQSNGLQSSNESIANSSDPSNAQEARLNGSSGSMRTSTSGQASLNDSGRTAANGSSDEATTSNASTNVGATAGAASSVPVVKAGSSQQLQQSAPSSISLPARQGSKDGTSTAQPNLEADPEDTPTSPTYSTIKTPLGGPVSGSSIQNLEVKKHIYALQVPAILLINSELVKGSLALQAQHAKNNPDQPAHPMDGLYKESVWPKLTLSQEESEKLIWLRLDRLVARLSSNLGYLAGLTGTMANNVRTTSNSTACFYLLCSFMSSGNHTTATLGSAFERYGQLKRPLYAIEELLCNGSANNTCSSPGFLRE